MYLCTDKKRNKTKTLKAKQPHKSVCSFSCFLMTKISINQLLSTIIRPFVLGWLLLHFLHLPLFFLKGPCVGWGCYLWLSCASGHTYTPNTHTHTLSQDERAVTLPANMTLQPWVEWVVVEKMRTEYKRGKLLGLHVPAVRMKTMWQHTFQRGSFKIKHSKAMYGTCRNRSTVLLGGIMCIFQDFIYMSSSNMIRFSLSSTLSQDSTRH